jgi:starch synthase
MKILFAGAEAAPYIKVGGLGDVLGGLPKALLQKGVDARVVLPLYSKIPKALKDGLSFKKSLSATLGWRKIPFHVLESEFGGVKYYFIDCEQYFNREKVYGEFDDAERFAFFSKAVLEIFPAVDFYPDVLHTNDWHTALIPLYLNVFYRKIKGYENIKTVLSIHNIEFQGQYDPYILGDVFGLGEEHLSLLLYNGSLNILKGGIESSDRVSTVSETYAKEILSDYFSFGLNSILKAREYKLSGIVNGIDLDVFNPMTDEFISNHYDLSTVRLKSLNKKNLQKSLGLSEDVTIPVMGMVTRLTPQKGLDLIKEVIPQILENDIQFIILGTGFPEYESFAMEYEHKAKDKFRGYVAFSAEMASKVYAGSDLFLMPSKSEPCGLAQMIAMRYGTIPIVHTVGGLKDTVSPFNHQTKEGNGITFNSYNAYDMLDAIKRALDIYHHKTDWRQLRKNAMNTDFSWEVSANKYIELYKGILG